MNTAALLSSPIIDTMTPEEVFHLLKKMEALTKVTQGVTNRTGRPMLGCFADLVDVDRNIDAMARS